LPWASSSADAISIRAKPHAAVAPGKRKHAVHEQFSFYSNTEGRGYDEQQHVSAPNRFFSSLGISFNSNGRLSQQSVRFESTGILAYDTRCFAGMAGAGSNVFVNNSIHDKRRPWACSLMRFLPRNNVLVSNQIFNKRPAMAWGISTNQPTSRTLLEQFHLQQYRGEDSNVFGSSSIWVRLFAA